MIYHPLLACKREFGDKMKSVFLQGTYPESEFTQFMKETGDELGLDIQYASLLVLVSHIVIYMSQTHMVLLAACL